jgi:hypothetical protein
VNVHTDPDFNPQLSGGNFWLNSSFDIVTTNEIAGAVTRPNGTGAELFQVSTGVQSKGLGCGQRVLRVEGGETRIPPCWLVAVPRGEPVDENVGTPFEASADQTGVATSPVAPTAWANRIAIPLEFSPVDTPCRLGDDERRISGNEMLLPAVASWQPALCGERQLSPFSYSSVGDPSARRQLAVPTVGSPGLVAISRPLSDSQQRDDNPVVYAPLAASGVAIAFNIERVPKTTAPDDAQAISGVRVADLNLTPRLVAKLLTQSYLLSVQIFDKPPYDWLEANPTQLGADPDFLRFNPEFEQLRNADRNFAALAVPTGTSDAAELVWEWVLSDPEARAWLNGQRDEWGMRVNPAYSTNPSVNSAGFAFGDPIPLTFPKADPYCYQSPPVGSQRDVVPPPLCGTDWLPYTRSFEESATMTRAAYDRARINLNPFAVDPSAAWSRSEPQLLGFRTFLSVTDTASASRYGVQTARLSRAGDNGRVRSFVGPSQAGLISGVESMKAEASPTAQGLVGASAAGLVGAGFREPDVLGQPPEAYPLTTLTYGAITPLRLSGDERSDFADFIRYAVTDGQQPGTKLGDLPGGYAPLPQELVDEALGAADLVVDLQAAANPAPTAPVATTPAPVATPPTSVATTTGPTTQTNSTPRRATTTPTSTQPPPTESAPTSVPETVTSAPETTIPLDEEEPEEVAVATVATPASGVGPVRYVVPVAGTMALASALLALELTKRPRRASVPAGGI